MQIYFRIFLKMLIICQIPLKLQAQEERFGILEKTGEQLPGNVMIINEDSAYSKIW